MKIIDKFKDLFDVIKYRKKANAAINMYHSVNEKYIDVLETNSAQSKKMLEDYKEKLKMKEEIKELKRKIKEDMIPKKNI